MRTRTRKTKRVILFILTLLLSASFCLWADGSESYHEPISFNIRWSVTNAEITNWSIEEYDPNNPIIEIIDGKRVVALTPDDGEQFQPVCKVVYSSNRRGLQEFYCNATPFIGAESNTSAGYTLRFVFEGSNANYDFEVEADYAGVYYHLPIELDILSTETGLASSVFYVSAKLTDWGSMEKGTNTATISFVKEAL